MNIKYMKHIAIIYPHQLFEIQYLPYDINKMDYIIITEDSLFFDDNERILKFNLLKLIYQRACMKYYESYLMKYHNNILYIDHRKNPETIYKYIKKNIGIKNKLHYIDPIDRLLEHRINIYSKKYNNIIIIYQTPSFMLTQKELDEYMKIKKPNNDKKFLQYNFYIWHRKHTGILMDSKKKPIGGKYTFDKYNRKTYNDYKKNANEIQKIQKYNNKFYGDAINYCEKTFNNHYPTNYVPNNIYLYPITHSDVKKHLKKFIKHKLKYFGEYQDTIDFDNIYMFHSVISPQLNNGLITPDFIIKKIMIAYKKNNELLKEIEGYFRQLNWREYSRLLYVYAYNQIVNKNFFKNDKLLTSKWYTGNTNILPVDLAIKMAFRYGYLHHIIRLMVMCNFMNLCSIDPNNIYKWFMEFSLDSYDWVMINNVYSMGLYADGGVTTTKPYISSSNYILNMSNIKKDGHWNDIWDVLYYYFIYRNYNKFSGRGLLYKSHWNNKSNKDDIINQGKLLLKNT